MSSGLLLLVVYSFSLAIIAQAQSNAQELHNASIGVVDEDHSELSRRIGQIFTLEELATMYDGAERWALQVLCEALPEGATPQVAVVTDAAFHAFSRRATDYTP